MIRLEIVESYELRPHVDDLRALERDITYPTDDDRFFIDHGAHYHPFFSQMGTSRFLLVHHKDRVRGVMAGVWREIEVAGERVPALYLADLKLGAELRGSRVVLDMIVHGIRELFRRPGLGGWRVVYGAAMRGAVGDVMRSMKGQMHPARWLDYHVPMSVYFAAPEALRSLPEGGPTCEGTRLTDFSPDRRAVLHHTRGDKDFRLLRAGTPWSLEHPGRPPGMWDDGLGSYLGEAARRMTPGAQACFALDQRLEEPIAWLEAHGVTPGAVCTMYAMAALKLRTALTDTDAAHVATCTI